ncbi:hypothetical protein KIN20_032598 [Parelaphostrongylus tenuis]|uniref:Uncharacterized protein n=1 Tax=Parelaphostrongylus tenuis TaxID=148309 RepID=A0AAD5R6U7_PARTN|nr:hypothetical protein KIN20_032598 [Parelaphostrongylus tenuis]
MHECYVGENAIEEARKINGCWSDGTVAERTDRKPIGCEGKTQNVDDYSGKNIKLDVMKWKRYNAAQKKPERSERTIQL